MTSRASLWVIGGKAATVSWFSRKQVKKNGCDRWHGNVRDWVLERKLHRFSLRKEINEAKSYLRPRRVTNDGGSGSSVMRRLVAEEETNTPFLTNKWEYQYFNLCIVTYRCLSWVNQYTVNRKADFFFLAQLRGK